LLLLNEKAEGWSRKISALTKRKIAKSFFDFIFLQLEAAVYPEDAAGNVSSFVGSKKAGEFSHFLRLAHPVQGNRAYNLVFDFLRHGLRHWRFDKTRRDGVD